MIRIIPSRYVTIEKISDLPSEKKYKASLPGNGDKIVYEFSIIFQSPVPEYGVDTLILAALGEKLKTDYVKP